MHTPYETRPHPLNGTQKIYKFDNGYGASVVKNEFTYGGPHNLWELGVIKWKSDDEYNLTYKTPITDDVIGYLTDEDVENILDKIEALDAK